MKSEEFLTNLMEKAKAMPLSAEQMAAVEKVNEWLERTDSRSHVFASELPREFVISGYAGTGKTFSLKQLVAMRSDLNIYYTAPTNKAARVLKEATGKPTSTIYSLLKLRLMPTGELKEIVNDEAPDLHNVDLIVVDEGSMVNTLLAKYIREALERHPKLRVLYLGDAAQLPPVGELSSPIWAVPNKAQLSKVMRHDSNILAACTEIRNKVESPFGTFKLAQYDDIPTLGRQDFLKAMRENAELFTLPGKCRAVAWRNVTVDRFNQVVRQAIFPGVTEQWVKGDRITLLEPAVDFENDVTLGATDDEGVVEAVGRINVEGIPCWHLTVLLDTNKRIKLWPVHPDGQQSLDNRLDRLRAEAKATPRLWRKYWEFYESFHRVRYAYAVTSHKSQGSTYETVFVDVYDILQNKSPKERFQCLYVACSRASKRLILCHSAT